MTKFCKDCKWHRPAGLFSLFDDTLDRCAAPEVRASDLVRGKTLGWCENQRQFNLKTTCGPKGAFFQSRYVSN